MRNLNEAPYLPAVANQAHDEPVVRFAMTPPCEFAHPEADHDTGKFMGGCYRHAVECCESDSLAGSTDREARQKITREQGVMNK